MLSNISINHQELAAFCQRHHIRRLSLFGSVLREDFRPDSDIDVLYVFDENHNPGWDISDIEAELSRLLGHRVEMVSERYLNRWIRSEVLDSAEVVYCER